MRIPRSTSRFTVIAIALTATARVFTSQGAAFAEQPSEIPFRHILIDANAPRYPECKAVGDINGDGFVDVLTASGHAQGLFWYAYPNWTNIKSPADRSRRICRSVIWITTATWMSSFRLSTPAWSGTKTRGHSAILASDWIMHQIDNEGAHDVEVGDIDRDGRLDVVPGRARPVSSCRNVQASVKLKIPTGGRGGTALGDLDGDADLDIGAKRLLARNPFNTGEIHGLAMKSRPAGPAMSGPTSST